MKTETKLTERTDTGEYMPFLKSSLRIFNGLSMLHSANDGWVPDEFQKGMAKRLERLESILPFFSKLEFTPLGVWNHFREGLFLVAKFAGWNGWWEKAWIQWCIPAQDGTSKGHLTVSERPYHMDLSFFDTHCWLAAPRVPFRPELEHVPEGMSLEIRQRRKRPNTTAPWRFEVSSHGSQEDQLLEVPTSGAFVPVPTDEKTFTRLAERRYFLEARVVPMAQSRKPRSIREDEAAAEAEAAAAEAARKARDGSLNALLGKFID